MSAATSGMRSTAAATGTAQNASRLARAQWIENRLAELLDVPYFHVVFTAPGDDRRRRPAEQSGGLQHSVPCHGRDSDDYRGGPQASGSRDRLLRSAPQLGTEPAVSSAPALRGARRRTLTGRPAVGLLRTGFLPASPGSVPPVPAPVSGSTPEILRCRQASLFRRTRAAS